MEAVMGAEDMDMEAVQKMLMNLMTTTVADIMKVSIEIRDKGKGAEWDTSGIRVVLTAPYLAMVLITEG